MKKRGIPGPPEINEIQFLDEKSNQLSWEEHLDDKKVKDESEWHDVDFKFTATHPDWGMDDNVKEYFANAQKHRIYKNVYFPDDTDDAVAAYK